MRYFFFLCVYLYLFLVLCFYSLVNTHVLASDAMMSSFRSRSNSISI